MMPPDPADSSQHHSAPVPSLHVVTNDRPAEYLHDGLRVRLRHGDREGTIDFAHRLRVFLRNPSSPVGADRSARLFLSLASSSLHYEGVWQALTELYTAALRAGMANERATEIRARERLALIHAAQGRLREARRAIRRVEQLSGDEPVSAFVRGARALIAVEELDADAESFLDGVTAEDIPEPYWPFLLLARSRWKMTRGGAAAVLEAVALARVSHNVQPQTFADSVLLAIRATALTAMGRAGPAAKEVAEHGALETPELALARARAEIVRGSLLRGSSMVRELSASHEVGPSIRAEALLLSLWSHPRESAETAQTIRNVRALVEVEGIHRVAKAVPVEVAQTVWPDGAAVEQDPWPAIATGPALRGSEYRALVALSEEGPLRDVAERLGVSINTLKTHARVIYQKLGVSSRAEAVRVAHQQGLLDPGVAQSMSDPRGRLVYRNSGRMSST